jgi:hypothetical protein
MTDTLIFARRSGPAPGSPHPDAPPLPKPVPKALLWLRNFGLGLAAGCALADVLLLAVTR